MRGVRVEIRREVRRLERSRRRREEVVARWLLQILPRWGYVEVLDEGGKLRIRGTRKLQRIVLSLPVLRSEGTEEFCMDLAWAVANRISDRLKPDALTVRERVELAYSLFCLLLPRLGGG